MSLELIVKPREVMTWEEFCRTTPPFAIALDGYVRGATIYDLATPRINFNHHEDVDRLSTYSTCGQVFNYVKGGLFTRFQQDGIPRAMMYINDPDQDTSLAVWLLRNHQRIEMYRSEPLLSRLVFAQDKLDVFGGAYPFDPSSEIMQDLFWIFEPYTSIRGQIPGMNADAMRNVVDAVSRRIDEYTVGRGEKRAIDINTQYTVVFSGEGWSIVEENGPYARTGLYHAGIHAFVTIKGQTEGKYHYSLGRVSPFIDFPLGEIYDELNRQEGIAPDDLDRWGGGNTAGGSPRNKGSNLAPLELAEILNTFLEERAQRKASV